VIAARDLITAHEAFVSARFDATCNRFRLGLSHEDARLDAIISALDPLPGLRILDLGCGKGRFSRELRARNAEVIGLDLSTSMLQQAVGIDRVRGSARRLPFRSGSFDAVVAVEVFEHLANDMVDEVSREVSRVLQPGGTFVLIDKNIFALDANRPWLPKVAVKWIDQKRGRWMYRAGDPVRERWFRPRGLGRQLSQSFTDVRVAHLLSRFERDHWVFRNLPVTRLFACWMARTAGGAS
jgi:ubiquinone/menaquinone biosynthesis C-methylase UbiE